MRLEVRGALSFCIVLAGLAGCGEAKRPRPGFGDPDKPIQAKVGQEFEIVLSSNPTTGYKWSLKDTGDAKVVSFLNHEYVSDPNPNRMTGVGGTEYWIFRATGAGETKLAFTYSRGRPDDGTESITYKIVVK